MDAVTLALAKAYTNANRLAYIEPGKTLHYVIDYDNLKAEDMFLDYFVKVSDEPLDFSNVSKLTLTFPGTSDEPVEFTNFKIGTLYDASPDQPAVEHTCLFVIEDGKQAPIVLSVTKDRPGDTKSLVGTWLMFDMADATLVIPETIHPIDPKYLPDVPVLDINEALGGALVIPYQEHSATNVDLSAYIPALMKGELRIKLKMMLSATSSADFNVVAHPLEIVVSEFPIPVYVVCLNAEVNGTILMLQVRLIPANGVGTVEVNSWALATK